MRRPSAALFALLAVTLLVAPIGAVVAQDGGAAGNASEFTLDDLQQDGPRQANSPPGVRMGERKSYWAVYWPANNPFAEVGSSESGEYLPPGHTVGRNAVFLRTWTYADRDETVHVVYWEKGSRTVTEGNVTTTEPVSQNVTHVTHEVTFRRGRPTVEIPLQQHDDPVRVTMWIEGKEWARWTFSHHSIATTQAMNIDSAGDYLVSVIGDFLVKIVVGGFLVVALVEAALRRAGRGTGYGVGPWLVGLSIGTALVAAFAYQSLADLVVHAPTILAGYVVFILGIVVLEKRETNVSKAAFLKFSLRASESATGEDAYEAIGQDTRTETILRRGGEIILLKPGLFPFLSRVFGSAAKLRRAEQLETRLPGRDGSAFDELFLIDPEAEHTLFYEPEGWTFRLPAAKRENVPEYAIVLGALGIAGWSITTGLANPLAVVAVVGVGLFAWAATPDDGVAAVAPAPIHLRQAYGSVVRLAEDVADAKTISEAKDTIDGLRISRHRDVEEELEDRDTTLVREMANIELPSTISEHAEATADDAPANDTGHAAATDGGVEDGE